MVEMKENEPIKFIKTLHKWPLSKVELVEIKGNYYILKTIHKDFVNEIYRQKLLRKICKRIQIPKIYWIKKSNKKISFLMKYIPYKSKLNKKEIIKIIDLFHKETKRVKSKYFSYYKFEKFYKDFKIAKTYLKSDIKNMTKEDIKLFFQPVFDSSYSVVHGDWGDDQIIRKNNSFYILDFGKSFFGPSILDFEDRVQKNSSLKLKAKLVSIIINIAWLNLCKRKYIDYSYKKEINKKVNEFNRIEQKLK